MKEDQLKDILHKHNNGGYEYEIEEILSAMKEAMREESIGFADWVEDNTYSNYTNSKGVKLWKMIGSVKNFTTDQLYNEWILSQNKIENNGKEK